MLLARKERREREDIGKKDGGLKMRDRRADDRGRMGDVGWMIIDPYFSFV
jgi:hypothetical protein